MAEPEAKAPSGIKIDVKPAEHAAPLKAEEIAGQEAQEAIRPGAPAGEMPISKEGIKVPLKPVVIKIPLRATGEMATLFTGYPGWRFTEEELSDIAELLTEMEIMVSPRIQAALAIVALIAVKGLGFVAWKRMKKEGKSLPAVEEGVANEPAA